MVWSPLDSVSKAALLFVASSLGIAVRWWRYKLYGANLIKTVLLAVMSGCCLFELMPNDINIAVQFTIAYFGAQSPSAFFTKK